MNALAPLPVAAVELSACSLGGQSFADVALQAASLLAVKLSSYYECGAAPAVLQALLDFAGARRSELDPIRGTKGR